MEQRAEYVAAHGNDVWVKLDEVERETALYTGRLIRALSLGAGLRDNIAGDDDRGIKAQEVGALGERIAAKWLGVYWSGAYNQFKRGDLAGNVEVRVVQRDHYGVRVYDNDRDVMNVVCVVVLPEAQQGPYRIAGWINAGEAKQRGEWRFTMPNGKPCFVVPQRDLRPMQQLKALLRNQVN